MHGEEPLKTIARLTVVTVVCLGQPICLCRRSCDRGRLPLTRRADPDQVEMKMADQTVVVLRRNRPGTKAEVRAAVCPVDREGPRAC